MGNSFNLVQEIGKINKLMQEYKLTGKRIEVLNEALEEFANQIKQNPKEGASQFNQFGGAKNWKTLVALLKYEEVSTNFITLKIVGQLVQSHESDYFIIAEKVLEELMIMLTKKDINCKNLVSQILFVMSENHVLVQEMRNKQLEIGIAEVLHSNKTKVKGKDKDFSLELEAKNNCISTVSNILSRPDEEKNKFNFVRARGLEALYTLATSTDFRDCIKASMTCLANMAMSPKLQEEMDFNGNIEDLPKLMRDNDGEHALFQCARFLFLIIEYESFLNKLIKNKTFNWLADLLPKVKEKRYTYLMFLLVFLRLNTTPAGSACISKIKGLTTAISDITVLKVTEEDLDNINFAYLMECILKMTNLIKSPTVNLTAPPNLVPLIISAMNLLHVRFSGRRRKQLDSKSKEKQLLNALFRIVVNLSLSHDCQVKLLKGDVLEPLFTFCVEECNALEQEMQEKEKKKKADEERAKKEAEEKKERDKVERVVREEKEKIDKEKLLNPKTPKPERERIERERREREQAERERAEKEMLANEKAKMEAIATQEEEEKSREPLLFCFRAIANLFVKQPLKFMEEDVKFTDFFIRLQTFGDALKFEDPGKSGDPAKSEDPIKSSIIKSLREEVKLILAASPSIESQSPMDSVGKFFVKCLFASDDYTVYRALGCLNLLLRKEAFKKAAYQLKIHKVLINHMLRPENYLSKEAVSCLGSLLEGPDGLVLWLKFSFYNFAFDHSLTNYVYRYGGEPERIFGLDIKSFYEDWGIRTKQGTSFVVKNFPELNEFSVSVWFYPPPKTKIFRTLLQGEDGIGGMIVLDPELEKFGVFDEVTGDFVKLCDYNAFKARYDWHNLICLVRLNDQSGPSHKIEVFCNGQRVADEALVNLPKKFMYFGNSKAGDEPFGTFSDLRIYNHIIPEATRTGILKKSNFPDKGQELLEEGFCCAKLVDKLKTPSPELQIELCRLARGMCGVVSTKMALIKHGIFDVLIPLVRHTHKELRLEVWKTITYLS